MSRSTLNDAKQIALNAVASCLPEEGVKKALKDLQIDKDVYLLAVGKAAFSMAKAASEAVKIKEGIVITKYGHVGGQIEQVRCFEAGHPLVDENSVRATEEAIRMCSSLGKEDVVLFLLSGGASALFESPLIPLKQLQELNRLFLKEALDIVSINTIRKKLSKVKGGRFADLCRPAKVYSIILSDVLSDRLDSIGSGPTAKDETSSEDALRILDEKGIGISEEIRRIISDHKSGEADNCENIIIGSVKILAKQAMKEASSLGYKPILIDDQIDIEARDAGELLFEQILAHLGEKEDLALILAGETLVHVKGKGLGGRNQELVFSQMKNISGMEGVCILSIGSDGTDGPTDAAGGIIDASSYEKFLKVGGDFEQVLKDNDTYHGLKMIDSLIITGPTGTNVNDLTLALIARMDKL
ncbi:MAG: DUF4147 domain-containing protein [Erysipelotrichaceae bacterium]|nr:DUF4147 domain-containing protein [Erysipelotrichaceae bacterium]